jgi:acetylornithine deacetylase/succinyl-diaminopimelate desuccinylase family protein
MTELELLSKLISFDTQSHKSNREIVDFIANLFPDSMVKIEPVEIENQEVFNLKVKIPGKTDKNPVIFSGHLDTVPTSSKWTKDPFTAEFVDGKLFGLGSSDMKAGLTAIILTGLYLIENSITPRSDVHFLFDCDEEVVGKGADDFLAKLSFENADIIIAEPTNCELQIGQKGVFDVLVKVYGKSFHSSDTCLDKNRKFNAIHKAMRIISELEILEAKYEKINDKIFCKPCHSICTIKGGTAGNVIPDYCEFSFNRRCLPSENMEELIEEYKETIISIDSSAEVIIRFVGNANLVDQQSEFMVNSKAIAKEVLGEAKISVMNGWTQAGKFNKWGNCLIWGPGDLKMAHQADEFCPLEQVGEMVECYKKIVSR